MKRPKKKPTLGQQVLGDIKGFSQGLRDPLNYIDPSPARSARSKKQVEEMRNKRDKDKPEVDRVSVAAAERLAKTKEEGRKRRKKFVKEKGKNTRKRRALLLNIEKTKNG